MLWGRLVCAVAAAVVCAWPQTPAKPTIRAKRIETPLELDGRLKDAFWTLIEPATGFTQRNPDEGQAATEETEVRFAFDAANL
jgi:hypothetical protein